MPIKNQVSFGIKWITISLMTMRGVRFLITVVLARLLTPEIFGIIAMATVTIELIQMIRELGFGEAFIYRQDQDETTERISANTTFFMGAAINTSVFIICFFLSPVIAAFFKSQELDLVLKLLFFTFVLDIGCAVPNLILRKNLEFGKLSICDIIHSIFFGLISITLALTGFGIWSIVYGQLCSQIIYAIMLIKLSGWRPRPEFSVALAKDLFSYGKFIWASVIVQSIGRTLDRAIIGRFFGATNLGFYHMAFNLCNLPTFFPRFLINKIAFPAFSKLKSDEMKLKRGLIKSLSNISIVIMPVFIGLIAVAEEFVITIYGEKWTPIVPLVKILSFYGLTLSISIPTGAVLQAIGKVNMILYVQILRYSLMTILIILLSDYGIVGISYAVLIPLIISAGIGFWLILLYLDFRLWELMEPIVRSCISSVLMFVSVRMFDSFILKNYMASEISLVVMITIGVLSYYLATLLINKSFLNDFIYNFNEVIMSKGKLI